MKFMFSWRLHQEKRHDAIKAFAAMTPEDDKKDMGESIRLIGRWHDMAAGTGIAIIESDNAAAVFNWALNWNSVLDATVTPVLDDEETRALGKTRT